VGDENLQILDIVARWPGSTHDARIFAESALCARMERGELPGSLIGDSGYPLKRYLMTPVLQTRNPQERGYNDAHTRTRVKVIASFAVLMMYCMVNVLLLISDRKLVRELEAAMQLLESRYAPEIIYHPDGDRSCWGRAQCSQLARRPHSCFLVVQHWSR
jgi:hypothetical protein